MLRVLVPNLASALISSAFLTATVVLGEFTIASLLLKETLPAFNQQLALRQVQGGFALGLLLLLLSTVLLALITLLTRRGPQHGGAVGGVRRTGGVVVASTLEFHAVRKTFGSTVALESFDLALEPGELVSLLGPSGCGKTTALRVAAGFEQADAGRVAIGGADVVRVPAHKRNIGMVFQSYSLFPNLTSRPTWRSGCASAGCPAPSATGASARHWSGSTSVRW